MYTVYKITNTINNRYYIGVHKTLDPYDSYMGSGLAIKRAIESYGIDKFTKDILFTSETRQQSYDKEKEIISECIDDPLCYNISYGGDGGWDYYNEKLRPHHINPMKDPSTARKNLETRKKNETPERLEHKSKVGRANIKKAIEYNTGRKRPRQSAIMKEKSAFKYLWEDKEQMRDKLSSWFSVVSPDGKVYTTNRLQEFCEDKGITYVSVWNTCRTGKAVTKGKAKGWICTIIPN